MKRIQIKYLIKKRQSMFTFHKEGHTLGNFIRSILRNIEMIDYSGYSVPHPSEDILNIRITSKSEMDHVQLIILGIKISSELSILVDNFFLLAFENYFRLTI
jgi:DNA-directed RNA polymerase I and III subunit RPAC2